MVSTPFPKRIADILEAAKLFTEDYQTQMELEPEGTARKAAYEKTMDALTLLRQASAKFNPADSTEPESVLTIQCRDCRHFNSGETDPFITLHGAPDATGHCALAGSANGEPDFPGSRAHAADHEEYRAALLVSPDYGCVQGQPK